MPLESLESGQFNIKDLTLEQEKNPVPEWQRDYVNLKKTPLYDADNKQWRELWYTTNDSVRDDRVSIIQLGAIAVEAKINSIEARNQLNHLRNSNFYNKEKDDWNDTLFANQEVRLEPVTPDVKFLECYDEILLGNREKAEDLYEDCKPTIQSLIERIDRNVSVFESKPYTRELLIAVIVEAQFYKQKAYQDFEKIKNSGFFDRSSNLWNTQQYSSKVHAKHATIQLLAILAEAQFDKEKAQTEYNELKKTKFYTPENGYWSDGTLVEPLAAFTGFLCEREFNESEPNTSTKNPLPETRSY